MSLQFRVRVSRLSTHSKGYLCGVGAVLIGSPTFVIVRVLKHSTAWTQLALRTPPFLFVVLCVALRRRTVRQLLTAIVQVGPRGTLASFCAAAQSVAIVCALLLTSASNVAIIINTAPVFCAIADAFVLKETVPCRTVAMICGGLVGVAMIVGGDLGAARGSRHNTGNLVALVNPISWACYWCILRAGTRTEPAPADQKEAPPAHTAPQTRSPQRPGRAGVQGRGGPSLLLYIGTSDERGLWYQKQIPNTKERQ